MKTRAFLAVGMLAGAYASAQTVEARLESAFSASGSFDTAVVWVYFRDKGDVPARLGEARAQLSERARTRRERRGSVSIEAADVPVVADYVRAVSRLVERVRHESRWLNAVSVEATREQLEALSRLPFVRLLTAVGRQRKGADEPWVASGSGRRLRDEASRADAHSLDYGSSFGQLEQIGVPALHAMGLDGEGVVVAVFDTGFRNLRHEAFSGLDILARRDFVNGDTAVGNNGDRGDGRHGSMALSVLAGFLPGELIGPAYRASFLLAKTENTESETPLEEDNWVAALEWAEARGADVISSSLGYLDFDAPFPGYTFRDMDGRTAVTTAAAQMAAERGIVVVTSAGNGGFDAERNTLGAPADGELVLSIGAVDSFGQRAEFSSVGRTADGRIKPDVVAQGVLVKGVNPLTSDGYVLVDGTSFSCPLAAGVVALLLQAHPEWTVSRVRRALRTTADNAASPNRLLGWGIIDAPRALSSP